MTPLHRVQNFTSTPMQPRPLSFFSLAAAALAASAPAQDFDAVVPASSAPARALWSATAGITPVDGELWAGGPGYKARFLDGAVEYTPILGREAPHNFPVTIALESIRRGEREILAAKGGARAVQHDSTAVYSHAAATGLVEERYEALPEGLEQSLVFAEPLGGDGDLVARFALSTELDWPSHGSADSLRFELAGRAALEIGAVTGIDAAGVRASGSLRLAEGALELVLPDAFLDSASYPLVLDPLYGTNISVSTLADDDRVNVTFDSSTATYLVTWDTQISLTDSDIRGQRCNAAGVPFGGLISIDPGAGIFSRRPQGGEFNTVNTFFVAYERSLSFFGPFDVHARAIPSATGVPSAFAVIGSDPASEVDISVGSDYAKFQGDPILCLWEQVGGGIRGAKLSLSGAGVPQVDVPITVSTSSLDTNPAVSKIDGFTDSWLVLYQSFNTFSHEYGLATARYQTDGTAIPNQSGFITSATGGLITNVSVDAMGYEARWLMAYEVEEAADPSSHDIELLTIALVNGILQAGPAGYMENDVGDDEIEPDVTWTSNKFYVAYCDEAAPLRYDLYVTGVNPQNCTTCESEMLIAAGPASHRRPSMSTMVSTSTGVAGNLSLVAWSAVDMGVPFDSDVLSQAFTATSSTGTSSNLGGGCGSAGAITLYDNPAMGNGAFQIQLLGIDPLAVLAILNITPPTAPIGCGTCLWDPFFATFTAPIMLGTAAVHLPIPCDTTLVGGSIEAQWTVGLTSTSPCSIFPNFSVSDRMLVTIGL
jgi:hypothetical protein